MVKHRGDDICGVLLLDKPTGLSSNHALQRVKRLFNAKKAGHTGSLDPLATGLLPLCFGKATCLSEYFLHSDKKYTAHIQFGVSTDSHDSDGAIVATKPATFSESDFQTALASFVGHIEQTPPMVSALKHKGQPLYKLALKGQEVERKARKMTVFSLQGELDSNDCATINVHCTSGFYVRQLAADLGDKLGCGAHITQLRRIASKEIVIDDAVTLDELNKQFNEIGEGGKSALIESLLLPPDNVLYFMDKLSVSDDVAAELCHGKRVIPKRVGVESTDDHKHFRVYSGDLFLGISEFSKEGAFKMRKLFNSVYD